MVQLAHGDLDRSHHGGSAPTYGAQERPSNVKERSTGSGAQERTSSARERYSSAQERSTGMQTRSNGAHDSPSSHCIHPTRDTHIANNNRSGAPPLQPPGPSILGRGSTSQVEAQQSPALIRNPNGLLIREHHQIPESAVDLSALHTEVGYLRRHVVIVTFLEPLDAEIQERQWIPELEDKIRARVELYRPAGAGFYYIKLHCADVTQRVLNLTTCKLIVRTAFFQGWVPAFNPRRPTGLVIPAWIRLDMVPLEYLEMMQDMASYVGTILDIDYGAGLHEDPRYCVAVDPEKGWISTLLISNGQGLNAAVVVLYENKDVRCGIYFDVTHLERECPQPNSRRNRREKTWQPPPSGREVQTKPSIPNVVPTPPRPMLPNSPVPEIDQEGFILVQNRR